MTVFRIALRTVEEHTVTVTMCLLYNQSIRQDEGQVSAVETHLKSIQTVSPGNVLIGTHNTQAHTNILLLFHSGL